MEGTILSSKSSFKATPNQQPQVDTKAREIHMGSDRPGHFHGLIGAYEYHFPVHHFPHHHTQKVGTKLSLLNPSSLSVPNYCTVVSYHSVLDFTQFLPHIFLVGTASEVVEVLSTHFSVLCIQILKPKVYLHVTAFPWCSSLATEEGDSELWNYLPQTTTEHYKIWDPLF